jgi:hypothetical protein
MSLRSLFFIFFLIGGIFAAGLSTGEMAESAPEVEILRHEWRPDAVWEKIGKTKFIWSATVRNRSNLRRRVFVYYDLLNAENVPVASNVANRIIEPHQTVDIVSDSYINTNFLPKVKGSRATLKLRFPN